MNETVSYLVYLKVREGLREWSYNTLISVVTPPTDKIELETVLWLKAIAENPSADAIEIISYRESL